MITRYDGGMVLKKCPRCGANGLHFALVDVPDGLNKEELLEYNTLDKACKFLCTACNEEWNKHEDEGATHD